MGYHALRAPRDALPLGCSTGQHAHVRDEVEQEGEHAEDEPQVEADEAEHARVHERDEQRDAHLAPDVAEDLPLGLRAHALAARLVALALLAREQECQDEQDVNRVLGEARGGVRVP